MVVAQITDLPIKGQDVWVSGGPPTTDNELLTDEMGSPDYFLINSVNNNELHYFYVGYTVNNVWDRPLVYAPLLVASEAL